MSVQTNPQTQPTNYGRPALTGAATFWYVLGCICFGASYFAKVPAKAALRDKGLVRMTGWENFWYVLQNICFGAGYFGKVIFAKALDEVNPS